MKRIFALLLIVLFFVSCSNSKDKSKTKLLVSTSIEPIADIVRSVADTLVDINVLLPKGYSPENYELTITNMKELGNSDIYFAIGNLGFENGKSDKIENNNSNLKIVNLNEYDYLANSHSENDPHIWTSPKAIENIAFIVSQKLSELDTANATFYECNTKDFIKRTKQISSEIKLKLDSCDNRSFVIYHPSLTEYAEEFGLKQLVIETNGKEPNAMQLSSLIDQAKKMNVKIVFVQQEFDSKLSQSIAKELNAKIVEIDPLGKEALSTIIQVTNAIIDNAK